MDLSPAALEAYLARALRLARRSLAAGSYPVGAVLFADDGRALGAGANLSQTRQSPIHHAEMRAIGRAGRSVGAAEPGSLVLVTSGEPCLMCLGAVLQAPAIGTLVWAAGPVSSAGSAIAAILAAGYHRQRLDRLRVIAEPSPAARRESLQLLYRWCLEKADPRAEWFAAALAVRPKNGAEGVVAVPPRYRSEEDHAT